VERQCGQVGLIRHGAVKALMWSDDFATDVYKISAINGYSRPAFPKFESYQAALSSL
jgi:hypothetical protein